MLTSGPAALDIAVERRDEVLLIWLARRLWHRSVLDACDAGWRELAETLPFLSN